MCLFCFLNKFCWWFLGGSDITTGAFCMERQQINWGLNQNLGVLFSNFVFWLKMFYMGWGLWEKYKKFFWNFFKRGEG